MKDLCIAEGKLVWTLYCDLVCVDYGGSLLDCCLLSVLSALLSAKLPLVSMEDGQVKVNIMTQVCQRTRQVQSWPISLHLSYYSRYH